MIKYKTMRTALLILMVLLLATALFGSMVLTANALVVKYGSTGDTVKTIQTKLKYWGYYFGSVDGIFGSQTLTAVQYFQRVNGLTVDGIVGTNTAAALGMTLSSSSSSSSSTGGYSSSDVYLMSKCVYGEARGESYTGKVAVAAVVLNRIASSSFPNTVSGVIYQSGAFTCVSDGQINLGTNDECTQAVYDAINGWDPSGGALFYFNPATATSAWIWSRPQIVTIGQHIFCS